SPVHRLNRFDGERFAATTLSAQYHTWGWNQTILNAANGEWWLATAIGLMRFPAIRDVRELAQAQPKALYTTRDGLAGNTILRLLEDSRGDIWVSSVGGGGGGGLSRWERATNMFHHYTERDGLPSSPANGYATSFCEDRAGDVWIGFSIG